MSSRRIALLAGLVALVALLAGCGATKTVYVFVPVKATSSRTAETPTAPAVAELQRVMARLGYYYGPIDGVYGQQTTAAIAEMQKALGVTADGVYGPETHAALGGKATNVVVEIQTALAEYGYYQGAIDGVYGTETIAAVQQLQTDLGITADGRFGPETANAFNDAVANGKLKPA